MSTATIYADRRDAPNDEATGIIGGSEPGVPDYWEFSVRIARNWEAAQLEAATPDTRRVALRAAMVMSPDRGGVFDLLLRMARLGLGGPVNLAAPQPLPQRDLMRVLRRAWGRRPGLPATAWMAEIGAWVLRTDTELLLKSRRVVPGRLLDAGYEFQQPDWAGAADDLVRRVRTR